MDDPDHFIKIARLFQVTKYTVFSCNPCRFNPAIPRVHDDLYFRPYFFQFFKCLNAVHPWHFLIEDNHFRVVMTYNFNGVLSAGCVKDSKSSDAELPREGTPKTILVVYHQHFNAIFIFFGGLVIRHELLLSPRSAEKLTRRHYRFP